ncbi:MAG TPA: dihydrolipoamide acetyltransferase family protein [Phycisphaerae bacterium]|nr:dihydrolipoamide acetyltransferase family protein [Phycisphaerae bacterium]
MIQKVTLPKLGETVEVSTIERWLKKEGDAVAPGDILCEITTDKATLEVESYHRGTLLKILAKEGQELSVGAVIAVVGDPGEKVPQEVLAEAGKAPAKRAAQAAPSAPAEVQAAAAAPPAAEGRLKASPRARRRAKELGVAIESIRGTGPAGRIVEADIEAAVSPGAPGSKGGARATPLARKIAAREGVPLAGVSGTGAGGKVMKADVLRAKAAPAAASGRVVPLSPMRRIVAERMLLSKQTIPCYYLTMDADVTDLVALRAKLNAKGEVKISYNDFVLKVCGLALQRFPAVNSRWVEGGVERRGAAHVGLAVALDEGLIVPVVRDVDKKSVPEIARETADLAQRARSKRLRPDEYQGGCMTVSNLGMYGIRSFIPVVNPGESVILGLGVIEERPVCRQGKICVRQKMTLVLSADHRLVDGAVGAQFLEMIRDALEEPQKLVE